MSELARTVGVSKRTIRRWMGAGLPAIRDRKPALILGQDAVDFLNRQPKLKARCGPGQFFCFRCRAARASAFAQAEIAHRSASSVNLRALCGDCSGVMYRRVSLRRLLRDMPEIDVRDPQAEQHLTDTTQACENVTMRAGRKS